MQCQVHSPERPSMARRFINQFAHQEASTRCLSPTANSFGESHRHLYLQVELSDSTGSIGARMWNASEGLYKSFENGDYIRVEGATQIFQGAVQLILKRIEKVDPAQVNPEDFTLSRSGRGQTFHPAGRNAPRHERSGPGHPGRVFFARRALTAKLMMARPEPRIIMPSTADCWLTSWA